MKKSLQAKMVDFFFKHFGYHERQNREEIIKRIEEVKKHGEKEYFLPPKFRFHTSVSCMKFQNMKVYALNNKSKSDKLIIYLHGGGYENQPVVFQLNMIDKIINKTKAQVLMPIYPLLPFHAFGECYDILIDFYTYVLELYSDKQIILLGDSAGGGLVSGLCEYFLLHNIQLPSKAILLSPAVDMSMDNPEIDIYQKKDLMLCKPLLKVWGEYWAGSNDNLYNYLVSPLYGEVKGFPNTYIYVGTNDVLYPDIIKFSDKLKTQNVKVHLNIGKEMGHVWPAYPIPEARDTIDDIADVINDELD